MNTVARFSSFLDPGRRAAATPFVLGIFAASGYSRDGRKPRPEGEPTSDDWIDVCALRYEPYFEEHVKEAFAPVGLMLDFWAESLTAGECRETSVIVINDLHNNGPASSGSVSCGAPKSCPNSSSLAASRATVIVATVSNSRHRPPPVHIRSKLRSPG